MGDYWHTGNFINNRKQITISRSSSNNNSNSNNIINSRTNNWNFNNRDSNIINNNNTRKIIPINSRDLQVEEDATLWELIAEIIYYKTWMRNLKMMKLISDS